MNRPGDIRRKAEQPGRGEGQQRGNKWTLPKGIGQQQVPLKDHKGLTVFTVVEGGGEGKGRTLSSQHFSTFCWRSLLFYNSTATCSVRRGPDVSPREKERKGSVLPASLILLMAARPVRFIQHLVRENLSHRTMASCRVLRWIIHTHTATSFFSLLHFFLCCPFRPLLFLFPCPPPQNLLPLLFPYIQARARRTQLTSHDQSLPVTSGY